LEGFVPPPNIAPPYLFSSYHWSLSSNQPPTVFNLVEGIDIEEQEHKIDQYKRTHADEIARNEAKKAERLREQAAADAPTAELRAEVAEHIGVSGTAAAFHGGKDPEPHQGMEYTAAMPTGAVVGAGMQAAPVAGAGLNTEGDVIQQGGRGRGSKEEWLKMATSSGWSQEFSSNRAIEVAFGSVLCF
jgi:hypothetical protein